MSTVHEITGEFERRLNQLSDRNIRLGGQAIPLTDPRPQAHDLVRRAHTVLTMLMGRPDNELDPRDLLISVGAQAVALVLALDLADEMRVDAGDDEVAA